MVRVSAVMQRRGLRGLARAWLVAVLAVFSLNSALLPCCEVVAAVLGGHAGNGSPTPSAAPVAHHSSPSHSEPSKHDHGLPCGDKLSSVPAIVGEHAVLISDRPVQIYLADNVPVARSHATEAHPTSLSGALARAAPLPSLALYMRTQRLLV